MAKWKELSDIGIPISTPAPEAIVRAALERAAHYLFMFAEPGVSLDYSLEDEIEAIRSIADDPAEVAAIIKKAGEDRG
jgi:hypothetical protein